MPPRNSEDVERGQASRPTPRIDIELRTHPANESCGAALGREHSVQEKQSAGLHRFDVGAKRLRRRREIDAKLLQPLLGARLSLGS
jgi:hypothetical protein